MFYPLTKTNAKLYHSKAVRARYTHYFILTDEILSRLADKGTVVVCDKPFTLIAVFPHPPSGWIHFATDDLEFFKDNFWSAIKTIRENIVSLGVHSLRIGVRERSECEYFRLFSELGFRICERIPIMEKYDYNVPDRGCPDVEIRRGSEGDIDALVSIENAYFPSEYRLSADNFRKLINDPGFYVATCKERVVGYLWLMVYGDVGQIVRIAVHPDYQGHCVGERILAFCIDRLSELGVKKIFIRTSCELAYEIKLLEKFGFKHVEDQVTLEAELRVSQS